jgi:rod shape determining protein RodA
MASSTRNNENPRLDTLSIWMYVGLVLIGLISIYSATSDVNQEFSFSFASIAGRQVMWIGGALLIILTIAFANVAIIDYFAFGFYAITILLNIAVLFLGKEVSGAKSWFGFGGVGIQPSEFAKVGTALAMAKFLGFLYCPWSLFLPRMIPAVPWYLQRLYWFCIVKDCLDISL